MIQGLTSILPILNRDLSFHFITSHRTTIMFHTRHYDSSPSHNTALSLRNTHCFRSAYTHQKIDSHLLITTALSELRPSTRLISRKIRSTRAVRARSSNGLITVPTIAIPRRTMIYSITTPPVDTAAFPKSTTATYPIVALRVTGPIRRFGARARQTLSRIARPGSALSIRRATSTNHRTALAKRGACACCKLKLGPALPVLRSKWHGDFSNADGRLGPEIHAIIRRHNSSMSLQLQARGFKEYCDVGKDKI